MIHGEYIRAAVNQSLGQVEMLFRERDKKGRVDVAVGDIEQCLVRVDEFEHLVRVSIASGLKHVVKSRMTVAHRTAPVLFVIPQQLIAQPGPDLDQLRQQLQLIQAQIDAATAAPAPRTNVTQIGGPRVRSRAGGAVVRIYDLGDLFAVAPPYAAATEGDLSEMHRTFFEIQGRSYSGGGGVGGGFFNIGPAGLQQPGMTEHVANQAGSDGQVRTSQDQLIKTIKQTIAPDVWDEAGGESTIAKLGNAFIISTDEETHSQIDSLMNLFRERWGTLRTISVRAWWVWLAPNEIAPVLDSEGEPVIDDGAPAFGIVPDDAWTDILEIWSSEDEARPRGYQATLTCYNGQTVHTISGDQGLAVTDIRPVLTRDENNEKVGRVAYRPKLSVVHEGLAFQITPMSNVSGKTLLLDLHSRITTPLHQAEMLQEKVERIGDEPSPEQIVKVIDDRRLNIHRLSTTVRVPVNRPMLVGGMSSGGHQSDSSHNLYLFVKASIQELRNDRDEDVIQEPEEAPAPPEPSTEDVDRP